MKMYVNKDNAARKVIADILDGKIENITATVSKFPSVCLDIWGNYMNTVDYIRACGCTAYVFPEKGDKK